MQQLQLFEHILIILARRLPFPFEAPLDRDRLVHATKQPQRLRDLDPCHAERQVTTAHHHRSVTAPAL